MITTVEWQFGGWLAGLSPMVAWGVLGLLAVAAALLVIWLYRRTLRTLPPAARSLLTALRISLVVALLLCLANPSRVTTHKPDHPNRSTLAVVVDRSDSMNAPDARGNSRLQGAARIWRRHVDEAAENFARSEHYQFSSQISAKGSLDAALEGNLPGPETHLFATLNEVVAKNPGAVVCLTDGIDTTGADAQKLASSARGRGVPLYFVAGSNRLRTSDLLNIRDIRLPARVLRKTQFSAKAVLEITSPESREIPVELWSGPTLIASQKFSVRPGLNTFPWDVPVSAEEAGPFPLEFRVGSGESQQVAGGTTAVVEKTTVDILHYQGALQWGYRFLLSALRADPSFRVTSIINPALGLRMTTSTGNLETLPDLPDNVAELKKFQIVVLAHVFADQLSDKQQMALIDYAKGGGGVLFIAPDFNATTRFAGTAVEQMLPVVFEPLKVETPEETAARKFKEEMLKMGNDQTYDTMLDTPGFRHDPAIDLLPFALPAGVRRSKISDLFSPKDPATIPQFNEYAPVRHAKPGAEILAVHPTDRETDGKTPRVLLAREQFGEGFTAALTTDLLWRWKMSLPHESTSVEKFWQQLFLSLTPPTGQGLRLVRNGAAASVNQPVSFRVEGAGNGTPPKVMAIPQGGEPRVLDLQSVPGGGESAWQVVFTPENAGRWELQAVDELGGKARMTFPVNAKAQTLETANIPADVEGLRLLAESTGGSLIEESPVFQPRTAPVDTGEKRSQPLWNVNWFLGLLLGLYTIELVARRWFKLL